MTNSFKKNPFTVEMQNPFPENKSDLESLPSVNSADDVKKDIIARLKAMNEPSEAHIDAELKSPDKGTQKVITKLKAMNGYSKDLVIEALKNL